MTKKTGKLTYSDVRKLLDASELTDVVVYEILGTRADTAAESFTLQVLTRLEDNEFEIRCKASVSGHGGRYDVDAGAVFALSEPGKIEEGTAREFAEKVGVMAVYPYLRATISQTASSLGLDRPVLPLLRSGAINLAKDSDSDGQSSSRKSLPARKTPGRPANKRAAKKVQSSRKA
jgi:hypothetical protein